MTDGTPPNGSARWLRRWWIVCGIAGGLLFLSQLVEIPWRSALRGSDNTFNYLWLRSGAIDGDWDFRNDIEIADTLTPEIRAAALATPLTPTGRVSNKFGIGWALLSVPWFLVADGIVAVAHGCGVQSLPRDGFNPVYQICMLLGHALYAVLALRLAVAVVSRWLGGKSMASALAGVSTVWIASPLFYYQTADLSMSHAATFLAVTSMAWALAMARERPEKIRFWLLAGASLGLAAITRFQAAVFGVAILWAIFEQARRAPRHVARVAVALVIGALPLLTLQMWAWHVVYGRWLVFSYAAEGAGFNWSEPRFLASLFSPWHGLFYWHPFLMIATVGAAAWAWTCRGVAAAWMVAGLIMVYVNAAWGCWWLASSFGNRAYDAALLPLMAGAAWLLTRTSGRVKATFWTGAAVAAGWNVYLAVLYRTGAISRSDPVRWADMIAAIHHLPASLHF